MPQVDLSDDDVALLEAARKAGGLQGLDLAVRARTLHDKLYTHADTAAAYQPLIKKLFPDSQVDADRARPFVDPLDARLKALEEAETKRTSDAAKAAEESAQGDFNRAWDGVVKDYSLTAEGEEKLVEFMKKRRLADPEAAAALYYKQNPAPPAPVQPATLAPRSWASELGIGAPEGDTHMKMLHDRPEAWADQEAAATLTEIRRQAA